MNKTSNKPFLIKSDHLTTFCRSSITRGGWLEIVGSFVQNFLLPWRQLIVMGDIRAGAGNGAKVFSGAGTIKQHARIAGNASSRRNDFTQHICYFNLRENR